MSVVRSGGVMKVLSVLIGATVPLLLYGALANRVKTVRQGDIALSELFVLLVQALLIAASVVCAVALWRRSAR